MACRTLANVFQHCKIRTSKPGLTYCQLFQWKIRCASASSVGTKKGPKGATSVPKKKELAVETDAKILCSRLCGGNIYKEGEDPVLGPDSEYPEWLWSLRTDREPVPLEELSKDDPKYWRRLKIMTMRRNNKLRQYKQL